MEFDDIAAVVHFLRKVIWIVPGFTVDAYNAWRNSTPSSRAMVRSWLTRSVFLIDTHRRR